jgi:hypothetical protein
VADRKVESSSAGQVSAKATAATVTTRDKTYPNQLVPHDVHGLVLGKRHVGEHGRMSDNGRVRVPMDVGPPLPARGIRVACPDVLGLESLELLLRSKLVRLESS